DGNPYGDGGAAGNRIVRNKGPLVEAGFAFLPGGKGDPCESDFGACCANDGNCAVLPCRQCVTNGGVFQGVGTICNPSPCPQLPIGACCASDGSCSLSSEEDCHGQDYLGDGTACDPNPCPQPEG